LALWVKKTDHDGLRRVAEVADAYNCIQYISAVDKRKVVDFSLQGI
jgi:hypothetical protein